MNKKMNLRVPYELDNFLTSTAPIVFSTRTLLHGVSEDCIYEKRVSVVEDTECTPWYKENVKLSLYLVN